MKSVTVLFPIILLLNGCAPALTDLTAASVRQIAPDVPQISLEDQAKAAAEMESKVCPALNTVANACLITRDQARALLNRR